MEAQQSTLSPNDWKDEKVKSSSVSVNSDSTTETLVDNAQFRPDRCLYINAKGIRAMRLPFPPSELEIPIYDAEGDLVYTSTQRKKCSGDAILSCAKGGDLLSTAYFFGPGRSPVIKQLHPSHLEAADDGGDGGSSVQATGKWTSRATTFTLPNGRAFEWSYVRSKQSDGKKRTLLVLHQVGESSDTHSSAHRIAQLARTSEKRAPGSSRLSAGNGGELVLDADAVEWIDESMVVATCLLMLKKEIDRRRMLQAAVMTGGAGS